MGQNNRSPIVEETPEERKEIGLRDDDIPYNKVQVNSPEGLSPL